MDFLIKFVTNPLFLVLLAFILVGVTLNTLQKLNRGRAWKQIATETGLQLSQHRSGDHRQRQMSGTYRGRALSLVESVSHYYTSKRERGTRISTTIRLQIAGPPGVRLKFQRVVRIGSPVQAVTGDEAIDRGFDVESDPDWLARAVLASGALAQKVVQLKSGSSVLVGESEILFSANGRIAKAGRLRFLFEFLSDLADAVEAYRQVRNYRPSGNVLDKMAVQQA